MRRREQYEVERSQLSCMENMLFIGRVIPNSAAEVMEGFAILRSRWSHNTKTPTNHIFWRFRSLSHLSPNPTQPFGSAQDTAPHSSPTTTGRGEESGAFSVCANVAFAIYYSPCAQSTPSLARALTHTQRNPTIAREAKEMMDTKQPDNPLSVFLSAEK